MNATDLPVRLDRVIDDVGVGAFIKRLDDGKCAVIVDSVFTKGMGELYIAAMVTDKALERDSLPSEPADYFFIKIKDDRDWLVFSLGCDEVLIE